VEVQPHRRKQKHGGQRQRHPQTVGRIVGEALARRIGRFGSRRGRHRRRRGRRRCRSSRGRGGRDGGRLRAGGHLVVRRIVAGGRIIVSGRIVALVGIAQRLGGVLRLVPRGIAVGRRLLVVACSG